MSETKDLQFLELDIDIRMFQLWVTLNDDDREWSLEKTAAYMRAAYGRGYLDALREPVRGQLCIDNGFSVPEET